MQNTKNLSEATPNAWGSTSLVAAVGAGLVLVVIGTALALGLGIGLHGPGTQGNSESINLTIITEPTTTSKNKQIKDKIKKKIYTFQMFSKILDRLLWCFFIASIIVFSY